MESLSAAERTGVPEMLATIVRIAKTEAANGEQREAVRMLAMVGAEPDSVGQFFTQSESISVAEMRCEPGGSWKSARRTSAPERRC